MENTNFEMFSNHLVDWGLPKREIIDTKMGDPINQVSLLRILNSKFSQAPIAGPQKVCAVTRKIASRILISCAQKVMENSHVGIFTF